MHEPLTHERAAARLGGAPLLVRAGIAGLGRALPGRVVPNAAIAERLGVADDWIERRTGIRSRRHLSDGERMSDLAAAAGAAALADAGLEADAIDLVLVASITQDDVMPAAAPLVAHALGSDAGAIDVGAACTGFLSGLSLAGAMIEAGRAQHVLVVGAEALSRFVNFDDRRTAGLFADGAGAAVVSAGAGELGPVVLRSAGEHADLIRCTRDEALIRMNGHDTFVQAVASMSQSAQDAAVAVHVELDDIDLVVLHQANRRILAAITEKLALDPDRVVDAIADLGNTSAASIPLALCHAADEGRLQPGMRVLMAAFGAGATYGATVLTWGDRT